MIIIIKARGYIAKLLIIITQARGYIAKLLIIIAETRSIITNTLIVIAETRSIITNTLIVIARLSIAITEVGNNVAELLIAIAKVLYEFLNKMQSKTSRYWISSLFRKIKLAIIHIYRAQGSPHEIALGAAIGAFWGVFPTFGLSTPLIIILYRFIRFNVVTAFAGALVSNPITSPFLLFFSYQIGTIFISVPIVFRIEDWTQNLQELGGVMLIGATILSSFTAVLVYFITYYIAQHRQKQGINNKT